MTKSRIDLSDNVAAILNCGQENDRFKQGGESGLLISHWLLCVTIVAIFPMIQDGRNTTGKLYSKSK